MLGTLRPPAQRQPPLAPCKQPRPTPRSPQPPPQSGVMASAISSPPSRPAPAPIMAAPPVPMPPPNRRGGWPYGPARRADRVRARGGPYYRAFVRCSSFGHRTGLDRNTALQGMPAIKGQRSETAETRPSQPHRAAAAACQDREAGTHNLRRYSLAVECCTRVASPSSRCAALQVAAAGCATPACRCVAGTAAQLEGSQPRPQVAAARLAGKQTPPCGVQGGWRPHPWWRERNSTRPAACGGARSAAGGLAGTGQRLFIGERGLHLQASCSPRSPFAASPGAERVEPPTSCPHRTCAGTQTSPCRLPTARRRNRAPSVVHQQPEGSLHRSRHAGVHCRRRRRRWLPVQHPDPQHLCTSRLPLLPEKAQTPESRACWAAIRQDGRHLTYRSACARRRATAAGRRLPAGQLLLPCSRPLRLAGLSSDLAWLAQ